MPERGVDGKPTLGANGMSVAPAILSTAASLSPATPDSPSTKATSRHRTATTSAATSAMRGAAKRPVSLSRAAYTGTSKIERRSVLASARPATSSASGVNTARRSWISSMRLSPCTVSVRTV